MATMTASVVFRNTCVNSSIQQQQPPTTGRGLTIFLEEFSLLYTLDVQRAFLPSPMPFPCISIINDMDLNWVSSIVYLIN